MERAFIQVKVAVMLVSDAPSTLDEATGKLIVDKLTEAGHDVWPVEVIKDAEVAVRKQIDSWIDFSDVDVIIAVSGFDTDSLKIALAPLITKQLTGFSDLFRLLTYREIGTAAMLTEVIAAQCGHAFVFALPAARGAVQTALEKLLIPQLDCRTRPRNLVMRMPRHKANVPTSGPTAFPPTENTPFGVPPPPARGANGKTVPPPPPNKRSPSTHSTPPMPLVAVAPAVARTTSDPNITELDANAVLEESTGQPLTSSLEEAIEKSIEASGAELDRELVSAPLADDDPAVVAAKEHASKTPEAQAAAWVAAVELAASKVVKKAAAEREAREAEAQKRSSAEIKIPDEEIEEATDAEFEAAKSQEAKPEVAVAAKPEPEPEPKPKVVAKPEPKADAKAEEPRGKIEKASGKPAPKPDHAIDKEAAVIVEDPDLVEKRSKQPSIKPATTLPLPRTAEATDLPVFPARIATLAPPKSNKGWMLAGGLAVIGAIVLLVVVLGKRNTNAAPPTDPPVTTFQNPPVDPPPTPEPVGSGGGLLTGDPPVAPPDEPDIEIEPDVREPDRGSARTVPTTTPPKPPREPRPPREPDDAPQDPDDPDLTKAPSNPTLTEECDEVSCILSKYAKPCCERFKPATPPPSEKPPVVENPSGGPVELDKTLIRVGVERFRAQIIRCGEQHPAKGTVSLSVVVTPAGTVSSVSVATSPDPALGQCAAGIMKKATFAKTQNGGSFTYPFEF